MASLSRQSRPVLLDLSEQDFERGYTGSRPPSLISPKPTYQAPPVFAPAVAGVPVSQRSGRGTTIALLLAAIAASVITSKVIADAPASTTTVGMEAAERPTAEQKKEPARSIAAPVLAPVTKPVVQTAVAAPITTQPKPIAAAAPKPIVAAPAEMKTPTAPKVTAAPKATTPTYGIDAAGF